MSNRLWIALGIVCGCLVGLVVSILSVGPATLAQNPAATPTPDHYLYLPLAARNYCFQHRYGDWVVTGQEMVEDCTVALDGNLLVQSAGSLTLHHSWLIIGGTTHAQYGIRVQEGGNVFIQAGTVITAARDAAHFDFVVEQNARLTMQDSELHGCGVGTPYTSGWDEPVGLKVYAADAVLERNLFAGNYNGIVLMPGADNARIVGNRFLGNDWSAISTWDANAATIADNVIADSISGIWMAEGSNDHVITGNAFARNSEAAIFTFHAWNNEIRGNRITDAGWAAIDLAMLSGNNRVISNTIEGAGNGINLHHVSNNTVADNLMTGVDQGMELGYADGNLIAGNTMTIERGNAPTYGGLLLFHSSGNRLLNNRVAVTAQGDGVLLMTSAVSNTLQGNVISSTFRCLSLHFGADHNTVISNTFSAGQEQVVIVDASSHNRITGNSFLGSGRAPYDNGANSWDDGQAGNYWHDYGGPGPYSIPPNGTDFHPLLLPVDPVTVPVRGLAPVPIIPLVGMSQHITEPTVIADQAITVEHSLFIEAGGCLTLTRSTLSIAGGSKLGMIRVLPGGALYVYSSTLHATEEGGGYFFTVAPSSTLVLVNSEVRDVGISTGMDWGGLFIQTDGVVIENTRFVDNFGLGLWCQPLG